MKAYIVTSIKIDGNMAQACVQVSRSKRSGKIPGAAKRDVKHFKP